MIARSSSYDPLFSIGSIRFFQDSSASHPLQPNQAWEHDRSVDKGFIRSCESNLASLYPAVKGIGGVTVGVGFFNTINLAVEADATAAVVVDVYPSVALMLPIILNVLPTCESPEEYVSKVKGHISQSENRWHGLLAYVPEDYRRAFADVIQKQLWAPDISPLNMEMDRGMKQPLSILGDKARFNKAKQLIASGKLSVIYGSILAEHFQDVLLSALGVYEELVTVLYLSNVFEAALYGSHPPQSLKHLLELLRDEHVDPRGKFLSTASMAHRGALYSYDARTIAEEREGLITYADNPRAWFEHVRDNPKIISI